MLRVLLRLRNLILVLSTCLMLVHCGPVMPFTLQITTNGKQHDIEQCDINITLEDKSNIAIPIQTIKPSCSCLLSSEDSNTTQIIVNATHPRSSASGNQAKPENVTVITNADWKDLQKLSGGLKFEVRPEDDPRTVFFSNKDVFLDLPLSIQIRGSLQIQCKEKDSGKTLPRESKDVTMTTKPKLPLDGHNDSNNVSLNSISDMQTQNSNSTCDNCTGVDEPKRHTSSLPHSRPAHNNLIVIVVICVLIGMIVLAGSLILVSLVMHRKRLARRLAIHLRNLEEANHPEAVPLTNTPDEKAEKRVKLISLKTLDGRKKSMVEHGFQAVAQDDIVSSDCSTSVLINEHSMDICDNSVFDNAEQVETSKSSAELFGKKEAENNSDEMYNSSITNNTEDSAVTKPLILKQKHSFKKGGAKNLNEKNTSGSRDQSVQTTYLAPENSQFSLRNSPKSINRTRAKSMDF